MLTTSSEHCSTAIFHLQHVRGEHKPAELLTKTLGYTKLQQLFQTTDLNQAFHFHQTSPDIVDGTLTPLDQSHYSNFQY